MKKIVSFGLLVLIVAAWGFTKYRAASMQVQSEIDQAKTKRVLHLFAMSDYFPDDVIKNFELKYNCQVRYDNFSSNEELLAKLQAGAEGYDVIVPSDYLVQALISGRLIRELDKQKIPNAINIAHDFVEVPFDRGNHYAIPYTWGTTGLAYNKKYVKTPITSWNVLFEKQYSGHISLLDDEREVMGALLQRMGYSSNTTVEGELKKAQEDLIKLKPHVRLFASDPKQHLLSGDVWIAHIYSGDARQIMKGNPDIEYVVPQEGGVIWVDTMAIPQKASNVELAYNFINMILEANTGKIITEQLQYSSPNAAAESLIAQDELKPSALRRISVGKLEFLKDLGAQNERWDQLWTEAKSH